VVVCSRINQVPEFFLGRPFSRGSRDGGAFVVKCAEIRQFAFDDLGEKKGKIVSHTPCYFKSSATFATPAFAQASSLS
jgi:hypothetical protein